MHERDVATTSLQFENSGFKRRISGLFSSEDYRVFAIYLLSLFYTEAKHAAALAAVVAAVAAVVASLAKVTKGSVETKAGDVSRDVQRQRQRQQRVQQEDFLKATCVFLR